MAIWMDMTYSMTVWKGGLIGIIRAELEMAKRLHEKNPEIRFCRAVENAYVEIKREDLAWLWASEDAGDGYLKHMGRSDATDVVVQKSMPDGLKNAYAYSAGRIDRIRMLWKMLRARTPKALRFIPIIVGGAVYIPLKGISMTRKLLFHRKKEEGTKLNKDIYHLHSHPFADGDLLFAAGWYAADGIIKEYLISQIKDELPRFRVSYLIYDLVLLNESTAPLYAGGIYFERYFIWAMNNCDFLFYGGETARLDAESYCKKNNLYIKPGHSLRFGSEVSAKAKEVDFPAYKKQEKIQDRFILSVGTVDAKKNYSALYHAYREMTKMAKKEEIPQLIIVGGKYGDPVLAEMMELDPLMKDKLVFVRPSDAELAALYENCLFTVLPTWYEGWSLTLPESLGYGKFCLCSDVAPLREIAGDLTEYVAPDDVMAWAEKILYFARNEDEVKKYSDKAKKNFTVRSWDDCCEDLNDQLVLLNQNNAETPDMHMFYDLSLAFDSYLVGRSVSGILRTQLLLARYLGRLFPHMRFIVLNNKGMMYVNRFILTDLFMEQSIDESYSRLRPSFFHLDATYLKKTKLGSGEYYSDGQIFWMFTSLLFGGLKKKAIEYGKKVQDDHLTAEEKDIELYDLPFKKGDVFFSAGVGFWKYVYDTIRIQKKRVGFHFIQLIYDFTPILVPQVHTDMTRAFYPPFLEKTYKYCDEVLYGGETAMRDGIAYAEEKGFPSLPSYPIRFGSDITTEVEGDKKKFKKDLFEKIGIEKDYIMAVGSIEARKNHETLYLAYLNLLENHDDVPQMLFCGYPGWRTEDFLDRLYRDKRVKGKILIYSPSDSEMDCLYRNCKFTVLASLYEGWSLTLPESLNYGKFCLTTNADPMVEVGRDMLEYVEAYDVRGWAKAIWKYYSDEEALSERESLIKENWKQISWKDCGVQVGERLADFVKGRN